MYMLDTNICIYAMKHKPISVFEKLKTLKMEEICISSITLSELEYGIQKSQFPEKSKLSLITFAAPFSIIPFEKDATEVYGYVRAYLEKNGTPIGAMDTLIAAHALSRKDVLVTNNVREFSRIPDLIIENWVE